VFEVTLLPKVKRWVLFELSKYGFVQLTLTDTPSVLPALLTLTPSSVKALREELVCIEPIWVLTYDASGLNCAISTTDAPMAAPSTTLLDDALS
jgi:hypothetical protein